MVTENLSKIVENQIDELKEEWLKEVRKSDYLTNYRNFNDQETIDRGSAVYSYLNDWLKEGASNKSAEEYFEKVGERRFKAKFPLNEVHYALYLLKRIFWSKIDWRDKVTGSFETSNTTKIMNVFNNYFDLANFSVTQGYFKAIINSIDDKDTISKSALKSLLINGKLDPDALKDDEPIWRHV